MVEYIAGEGVFCLMTQCGAVEQVSTQVCRCHSRDDGIADGVSSVRRALRHRRNTTSSITTETSISCLQELGTRLVARQRTHVSDRRRLVATQPAYTCSYLRRRSVGPSLGR